MTERARVDPGHASLTPSGTIDPGAVGHGVQEAECVLEVSKLVAAMLRAHDVHVDLTRTGEPGPSADDRAKLLSQPNVACSLSIHANAAADPSARGSEIFYSLINFESQLLALAVAEELNRWAPALPARTPQVKTRAGANGEDYYYFIRHPARNGIPAVLIEIGFVTNSADAALLTSFWGRFAIAYGITRGVLRWLGRDPGDRLLELEDRLARIKDIAEGR